MWADKLKVNIRLGRKCADCGTWWWQHKKTAKTYNQEDTGDQTLETPVRLFINAALSRIWPASSILPLIKITLIVITNVIFIKIVNIIINVNVIINSVDDDLASSHRGDSVVSPGTSRRATWRTLYITYWSWKKCDPINHQGISYFNVVYYHLKP